MGRLAQVVVCATAGLAAACATLAGLEDPTAIGESGAVPSDASAAEGAVGDAGPADGAPADVAIVPPPTDAGPPVAYAVSGRFWTVRLAGTTWQSFNLPSGSCPELDEIAVDGSGKVFAVGTTGLYRVEPSAPTCSRVGTGTGPFPVAMTFAPRGTVDANADALVGYASNGDYVRVDLATAAISVLGAGALAGVSVGDLATVGAKGYVVMRGGTCATQDCVWPVDLKTGARIGAASAGTLPTTRRVAGLAQWSGKLYAFTDQDLVYVVDPGSPGAATSFGPPPGYVNVLFKGAASNAAAPAQ